MTDANVDLLRSETWKYPQNVFQILQSHFLIPTIDKPTRVRNIDKIFVNNCDAHIFSGDIVSDISDHFSQCCISQSFSIKARLSSVEIRDYSNVSAKKSLLVNFHN